MQKDKQLTPKLVTAIISAGIMAFAGVVAETAMNITFPTLMREFGIGTAAVQWLTTGYLLMLAIIVPASGWLKNNFSHKRLFIAAEAFFITGTVLCCAAPSFALLLTGRIVQGLGTGSGPFCRRAYYNIVGLAAYFCFYAALAAAFAD